MTEPILQVDNCRVWFDIKGGLFKKHQTVKAVDGVTFQVYPGETFGLVGESGCGKSTLGRTIVRLYKPVSGTILYKNQDITTLRGEQAQEYRKHVQMIFQDPYASLDPRMTVSEIIREPMDIHDLYPRKERDSRVVELLQTVGLKPDHIRRYPHEFSGGQRQRIGIARTLALNPEFIVCDEPISALDVSIQAQVINLLEDIQKKLGISYLFIAHDLSMVKHISDHIGVMYLGHLAEIGPSREIYRSPLHPYTQGLLSAVPTPDPKRARAHKRIMLEGEIPTPIDPKPCCPFATRCPKAMEHCFHAVPPAVQVGDRQVACFLYQEDGRSTSEI